ncbi:MAG: type 4a pilus biogenesis protein PilO [Actinomycetota bacterium]
MSTRARLILAIAAVVVLCVAFFFLFVRARMNELNTVREEIAAEENRTIQLQSELARLQDLQERAPELQAELAEIRQLVPQNHEVANFLFQIEDASNAAGVDFITITPELPKAPPEGAALAEVRLQIDASGGYFSLQDFVRRLYNLDRAVRIDLVTLTGSAEETGTGEAAGTTISLSITARMFFELPAAPGTAAPGTTTPPAPGTTPAPTTAP